MEISAAQEDLAAAVEEARAEALFLRRDGKPVAVLVSSEHYDRMIAALEDAEDVAALDAAMAEEGDDIAWEQVKVDLGLE